MIKAHFTDTKSNKVHVEIDVDWEIGAHLESDHALEGDFFPGETFSVSVVCEEGWHFVTWSDGNTIQENRLVQVGGEDLYLTARVWLNEYYIGAVSADETMGTVTGGGNYTYGLEWTLTAEPKEGYVFDHWNNGSTDNPLKITVTDNATYIAYFKEVTEEPPVKTTYTVTLIANPTKGGTFLGAGEYEEGSVIIIAANANPGWEFIGWNDDDTAPAARQIEVTGNIILVANFQEKKPTDLGDLSDSSDKAAVRKVVIDGQVYILRDGKRYTLLGTPVE